MLSRHQADPRSEIAACGAEEIQRIVENAARWPDMNT
jgi:hypothetical protein